MRGEFYIAVPAILVRKDIRMIQMTDLPCRRILLRLDERSSKHFKTYVNLHDSKGAGEFTTCRLATPTATELNRIYSLP